MANGLRPVCFYWSLVTVFKIYFLSEWSPCVLLPRVEVETMDLNSSEFIARESASSYEMTPRVYRSRKLWSMVCIPMFALVWMEDVNW